MAFAVLLLSLLAATVAGLLWRRRDGAIRDELPTGEVLSRDDLAAAGGTAGVRGTLVQFSSSFCSPCRATRQILSDVAGMVDGVAYVEIDAETHLDLVRRHRVLRTPTTMVLDARGRIVVRASGQPRKADVIAALGRALAQSTTTSPTP